MSRLDQLRQRDRARILRLAEQHGCRNVQVFGSVATGENRDGSDIDFLVDLDAGRNLFDLGGLLADLKDLLASDVDLVEARCLHPYIRDRVLAEAVPLQRFLVTVAAKDPRFYLIHIRDCCERILAYTKDLGREWPTSPMAVDAVCGNIGIIGEAASKLDPEFRQQHADVPWRSMINTRNFLIHAYDRVNPAVLDNIVEKSIPELLDAVERLLS